MMVHKTSRCYNPRPAHSSSTGSAAGFSYHERIDTIMEVDGHNFVLLRRKTLVTSIQVGNHALSSLGILLDILRLISTR